MRASCRRRRFLLAALVLLLPRALGAEEDHRPLADRQARVRTTDRRLRQLLEDGTRASPTLRGLVDRLNATDVVVYLQCDLRSPPHVDGRLTFVSSAGGFRYVVIRLAWVEPRERQLSILAHELQHALEIAEIPSVIDGPSLARAYDRIGFRNRRSSGLAFDTYEAIETGQRVLQELAGAAD